MQAADDPLAAALRIGRDRNHVLVASLTGDGIEGFGIGGGGQRILEALAPGPKRIVRQQADDFGEIAGSGRTDIHGAPRAG